MNESDFLKLKENRYESLNSSLGKDFEEQKLSLIDLYKNALNDSFKMTSGKQEHLEYLINNFMS